MRRRAYPTQKDNLPHHLTVFVGREREIAELRELLSDPACRLLTLVGVGGIGKTRLAIEAAAGMSRHFADGVYFAPLQAVQAAEFLMPALADTLDITLSGHDVPQAQLLNFLRDKELLLVLDNFEQLLAGAGLLTDLLQAARAVKFLVTSREVLKLQEEWLYRVEGMPYPVALSPNPPAIAEAPPSIETYPAVQLFVERARRVRRDFSLTDEQASVIRICRLVEGMPLALELAASWASTMPCAVIADEIERNLNFLATSLRNVPEQHRSMQAVFDHSWALLSQKEQAVFKRLSIFQGGFRREAAERVAGASLETLSVLVNKSLLRWEADGRYQIHELLRQYAAEQLVLSPDDVAQVYDSHCRYYADFLQERSEALRGGRQRETLSEIEAELENIRAAWQWAIGQLKVEQIKKSVEPLGLFYDFRGRYLEGVRAFEQALQRLDGQEHTRQVALTLVLLWLNVGGLYIRLGRLEEAEVVLAECQTLYHQLNLPQLPGFATDPALFLGIIASIRGNYDEAARLGQQGLQTSQAHNHLLNQELACYVLGRAALVQGQHDLARQYFQQAYALTQEIKDRWFMAYCLNELGNVARALGDYDQASQHYQVSYDLRKEFDDPEGMAVALNYLGEIARLQKEYQSAERLYRQSLAIYRDIGDKGGLAATLNGLGQTACAQGDYRAAQYPARGPPDYHPD
jgi:predicted ATPase